MTEVECKLLGMSQDVDFASGDSVDFVILDINGMRCRAMVADDVAYKIRRIVQGNTPVPEPTERHVGVRATSRYAVVESASSVNITDFGGDGDSGDADDQEEAESQNEQEQDEEDGEELDPVPSI